MRISFLLSQVFGTEDCACCGAPAADIPLCRPCLTRLLAFPPFGEGRCRLCGRELLSEQGQCIHCAQEPAFSELRRCFPVHAYRLWKKELLFLWKLKDHRLLSPVFARLAAQAIASVPELHGLPLVPVPPRPGKLRARGWDQVQELCRFLRRKHGLAVQDMLRRTTAVQQKHLDRTERQLTAGQSYVPAPAFAVRGRPVPPQVVLVDDVFTTGATLEACASVLHSMGVGEVYALTLFYV